VLLVEAAPGDPSVSVFRTRSAAEEASLEASRMGHRSWLVRREFWEDTHG
jgi:hypothetical protein